MARRRHEKEEEDTEGAVFTPPEFDRKEFIEEEINRARAAILPIILAIAMGIVSAYLYLHMDKSYAWPMCAAIGLGAFALMKFIYPMGGVDVSKLKKKDIFGHAVMYFFAWLAVFIIFMNPPFADYAAPEIQDVHIEGYDGQNWTAYDADSAGNYTEYRVAACVCDNTELALVQIRLDGGEWQNMTLTTDGNEYVLPLEGTNIHHSYILRATDIYGHEMVVSGNLP